MKFYIASRFTRKKEVKKVIAMLEKMGHEVTKDWTIHNETYPFDQNKGLSKKYSAEDIEGIRGCDIFIALYDDTEGSTGMHTEIGAAIALHLETGKPKVFVAGGQEAKSMFFFHPAVAMRESVKEILEEIDLQQ